jgi:hypothetical protein
MSTLVERDLVAVARDLARSCGRTRNARTVMRGSRPSR